MKYLMSASLTLALGLIAFTPDADASDRSRRFNDSRGDFHSVAERGSRQAVRIKKTRNFVGHRNFARHRVSGPRSRHHRAGVRHHRIESRHFRRARHVHHDHRRVIVSQHHHESYPGALIAGAVIGGVIGHEIGYGHSAATVAGVLIGSVLGHELSH